MRLADRVAVVTGAGSGIGRAIALRFGEEGARVIVNDVSIDRARATVDAMGAARTHARAVEADVADSRGDPTLGFTRAVAKEVASRRIRVNAICPGFIDTPMTEALSPVMRRLVVSRTPLGRIGVPQDVAATALFLASDDSAFFTGQWLSPNGGLVIQ
jgi:NAD(P)-dependent dehydrogenase (short-subunit alcohol dehydrogenase family)